MKKLLIILITGTVVIVAGVGFVAWLSWQPQPWYSPPDYLDSTVAQFADRAEYRLTEELHKIRPSEEVWRLRISDDAMNAWLSGRLEDWLTHDEDIEIPEEIQGLQVHATPEGVWLAAMVEIDASEPRPVAVQLQLWVNNGTGLVEPTAIRFGKVPIPMSLLNKVFEDMNTELGEFEPIISLMDDREVELQAIDFEEGAIVLTCQTHLPQ
jgi:hypothetical protein